MAKINYCKYGFSDFTELHVVNGEDLDYESVCKVIEAGGHPVFNISRVSYNVMVQRVAQEKQTLVGVRLTLRWDGKIPYDFNYMNIQVTTVNERILEGIVRILFTRIP